LRSGSGESVIARVSSRLGRRRSIAYAERLTPCVSAS
jgi:hypothetical protein